jgi:hypothetical protein
MNPHFFALYSQTSSDPDYRYRLYEWTPPATLATAAPFPEATIVREWGNPHEGHVAVQLL